MVTAVVWISAMIAAALAGVHLLAGGLRFLDVIPRSRWLSFGGGVSVAYVFVHILPELADHQTRLQQTAEATLPEFLEHHVYLLALLGLALFYGLDRLAKESRARRHQSEGEDATASGVFWTHILFYSAYNALIGYLLLHRESTGWLSLLLFATAMGTHFVVNDYGLRQDHKQRYHSVGRWMLSAAVVAGWIIGALTSIHRAAIAMLFAFLAGGIMLNVLKEELPEERRSIFWAFALGAGVYAALLLLV